MDGALGPVGDDAARWATRDSLPVLLVAHNVTAATRLLDILPLFYDDFRVHFLATTPGSSAFRAGLAELFAKVDVPVVPWKQAVRTPVKLAISASFGGQLAALSGKLTVLSHGVGYTKRLATPGAGSAPVFGLSREWLLAEEGRPVADALVLSHPEQLERLRVACPEAVHTAVLAGDPCFDRLLAVRDAFVPLEPSTPATAATDMGSNIRTPRTRHPLGSTVAAALFRQRP